MFNSKKLFFFGNRIDVLTTTKANTAGTQADDYPDSNNNNHNDNPPVRQTKRQLIKKPNKPWDIIGNIQQEVAN